MNKKELLLKTEIYPLEKALPTNLILWLDKNCPHPIFSTYDWLNALGQFKNKHQASSETEYFWLFVFDSNTPCVAAAMEKNSTKLKLLTNFYTPICDIFYEPLSYPKNKAWSILIEQLQNKIPNWLYLEVSPLFKEQIAILQELTKSPITDCYKYDFSANYTSSYLNFDSYWENRSSRLKNTYKRRLKNLVKKTFEVQIYFKASNEIKETYWSIYQRSWKPEEPSEDFINWLLDWAGKNDKLHLGILYVENRPAAFQLWLYEGETASIFKLAQDKAFDVYSPGTILTKHMVQHLSNFHGVRNIDFLLGNDDFKALWMDCKNDVFGIEIVNKSRFRGKLINLTYKIREAIKKVQRIIFTSN